MTTDPLATLESEVLGVVLNRPGLGDAFLDAFRPEQFSGWRTYLADALATMLTRGLEVSPVTVVEYLRVNGSAGKCGSVQVFEAFAAGGSVLDPASRFSLLSRRYLQRDMSVFAARLAIMADNTDPTVALEYARTETERLSKMDTGNTAVGAPTMTAFMGLDYPDAEWVIPNLIPSATSVMVTATEGMGKTVLLRQLAVSAALGIDPFDPDDRHRDYEPQRALIVDCEYSGRQVQRQLAGVARHAGRHRAITSEATDRVFVHSVQAGIDLTDPADQSILRGLIRTHRPTLMVIGPLYRATSKGYMDEDATRMWQQPLERIMSDGIAVVLEHHIGNEGPDGRRSLRPIGSSAMRRWAAQGIGFRLSSCEHKSQDCRSCGRKAQVERWRGSRDETYWPTHIRSPKSGGYWWERDAIQEGLAA